VRDDGLTLTLDLGPSGLTLVSIAPEDSA
jgi:hypothetical protein